MSAEDALGRVHVITGPGKGKTTAAFGLAMRAAGHGLRVCVIQFMKTGETTGEVVAAKNLPGVEVHQFGTGKFIDLNRPAARDRELAEEALGFAREVLSKGGHSLVVLDEVNLAVYSGMLTESDVLEAVRSRKPGTEVVLTGRDAPLSFIDFADYVTVIDSWKHPFEGGIKARKGIEW